MSDYSVATREQATDWMSGYEGFGEMLSYGDALEAQQVAITLRRMPADTGGRGSYGHRHSEQEELYLVIAGTLTFKVGEDVFAADPGTAVRVAPSAWRSVHNDTDSDVEVVVCSVRGDDPAEKLPEFWEE